MQPAPPRSAPLLLVADASLWGTSLLGVAVRHVICGVFFFSPGYVALQDSETPHRPAGERVSWCLELLFYDSLPGLVSIPNSFVSLFIFYILSYLLSNTMGCLCGCLVSSTSVQKFFCGICSVFRWSFDEFVGEKVFFLSCSSAILICIFFFDTTQNLTQGGFLKTSCNVQSESHQ